MCVFVIFLYIYIFACHEDACAVGAQEGKEFRVSRRWMRSTICVAAAPSGPFGKNAWAVSS